MRTFLAIDLPKEVKEELKRIQDEIKRADTAVAKYVEPENLHLTLKFFGEQTEDQTKEIKNRLDGFEMNKFQATLSKAGYFSEKFIRVLWVDTESKGLDNLINVIQSLFNNNEQQEKGKQDRENKSHVTIARIKKVKDKEKFKQLVNQVKVTPTQFTIDKITLKSSKLTKKGPVYQDLYIKTLD